MMLNSDGSVKHHWRGIQPGQVAWTESSTMLHKSTEDTCRRIATERSLTDRNIIWKKSLTGDQLLSLARIEPTSQTMLVAGVSPDGGIFLYIDRRRGLVPLFSVEAKEQQNAGNAIERWFKNYTAFKLIESKLAYITFCTGSGAVPDGVICRALNHAFLEYAALHREFVPRRWNRLYADGPSHFRRPSGFSNRHIETVVNHILDIKIGDLRRR